MEPFVQTRVIPSFQCGSDQKLRLVSLFNILQDAADTHASVLGVGYENCAERGLAWVGAGYCVKINRMPIWREKITMRTWPSGVAGSSASREFQITDEENHPIIEATSLWVLLDRNTLSPVSVQKNFETLGIEKEGVKRFLSHRFRLPKQFEKIEHFSVLKDDIDQNGHVNNAIYPMWAFETLPDDWRDFSEIKIDFKKSFLRHHQIEVLTHLDGDNSFHLLRGKDENGDVFDGASLSFTRKKD